MHFDETRTFVAHGGQELLLHTVVSNDRHSLYEITCSVDGREFDVKRNGRVIANSSRTRDVVGDCYSISIQDDEEDLAIMLCTCVAVHRSARTP